MQQADRHRVHVRVMANVNDMRRGQEFETELTERVEGLVSAGYLQILGHVLVAAPVAPPVLPEPPAAIEPPRRPARKKKATPTEVDDGSSESPAAA